MEPALVGSEAVETEGEMLHCQDVLTGNRERDERQHFREVAGSPSLWEKDGNPSALVKVLLRFFIHRENLSL